MGAVPLLLAILFFAGASPAPAAEVSRRVRATGLAAIVNGDLAAAHERARQSALREAVEAGVGVLISSTTQASNFAVIEEEIFVAARGYVRSYDVVEGGATPDGTSYRVTVDAEIDLRRLEADLAAIDLAHAAAGRPRFLCRGMTALGADAWQWSPAVTEALAQVLAPLGSRLEPSIASPEALSMGDVDLARRFLADVLIDARVHLDSLDVAVPTSERSLSAFGIQSRSASLNLQVRWLDEDHPVLQVTARGRGADAAAAGARRKAIAQAVSAVADTLRGGILEDLRRRAYARRSVALVVEGSPGQLTQIERVLRGGDLLAAAPRLRRRERHTAWFDVDVAGSAFELARRLSARGLAGLDVEILQASANRLRIAVARPR